MAQQKLILTQEVPGLGTAGDVVEVKNGYARNFLIPRGFATRWTRGAEQQVETIRENRQARELANLEDAQVLAEKLQSATVDVRVSAGDTGRLFGSVTASDIAEAISEAELGTVDRRNIIITDSIRSTGVYSVQVRLHVDVLAELKVNVRAENRKK